MAQQLQEKEQGQSGLQRTLKQRHMSMIAIGGVIGAGLFVGSGVVVNSTGPAVIGSFLITGLLVILVMRMLGEMAVAYPAIGGFYEYSRLAMGDLAGFLTGWMYWYFWVIVVALEAVAGATLLQFWLPDVPSWVFTLALMLVFTATNLVSVGNFGEFEFWFASIKVAAIVVFLLLGSLYVIGLWPGAEAGFSNLTAHGGFAPNGLGVVLAGAVAATGFYFGAEIVTIAAAESAEPARAVSRTAGSVIWRVLLFYVGSIILVVTIIPWNDDRIKTPYVSALETIGIPGAAHIMNAVVLTAVLSALNSGFTCPRGCLWPWRGEGTRRGACPGWPPTGSRSGPSSPGPPSATSRWSCPTSPPTPCLPFSSAPTARWRSSSTCSSRSPSCGCAGRSSAKTPRGCASRCGPTRT